MSEEPGDELLQRKKAAISDAMFFLACSDNKPIGKARHLHMLSIYCNLRSMCEETPDKNELWSKLRSLVNLELLEEKDEEEQDDTDKAHNKAVHVPQVFELSEDITSYYSDEDENAKCDATEEEDSSDKPVRPIKDYTRNRTPKTKQKEDEADDDDEPVTKTHSPAESDEDTPLKPAKNSRRSQVSSKKPTPAKKTVPKRGSRSVKDSSDASPASTSSKKTDEETSGALKKSTVGKRSLRSRGDDDGSSPTHTPNTRSRRI